MAAAGDKRTEAGVGVEDDLMFSRTGVIAPMGTLIGELKTKVDTDTALAFDKWAREHGTDRAGALRDYVYWAVHGKRYRDLLIESIEGSNVPMPQTGPIGGAR